MTIDRCDAEYCPACGQPRERSLPVSRHGLTLSGFMLKYGDKRERLVANVARTARVLLEKGEASFSLLTLRVCPDANTRAVHVYAVKLRRSLAELTGGAVQLRTIPSWGYELVEAQAERLAA
jgi:hypothetical protein